MNALLIHNDNLPTILINNFKNQLKFDIGQAKILEYDFSFDKEAHNQLYKAFKGEKFNVIFIPYSLSTNNYLELSGLRIALHIRLTDEFNHKTIPIVFIAHETKEQIAKLSDYGSFLFSSGTFSTTKFEYRQLEQQYEWIINNWRTDNKPSLSFSEYNKFLSRIKIKPPDSHQSNHSLTNEWAMYKWSKALGNLGDENEELGLIDNTVSTDLYFKYLIAVNKIEQSDIGTSLELGLKNKGKVLLIDDEANKGWYEIFCTLLCDNNPKMIDFHYIDDNLLRHKSQEEIIKLCKEEVLKIKDLPDVVILDLRIHPSDFTAESINEMTGFKILKEIKKINPGIQVIIFSATNKIWNLQALLKEGADDFIIKEGIENSADDNFSYETITKFIESINTALDRKFLKEISSICSAIKGRLVNEFIDDKDPYMDFIKDSKIQIDLIKLSSLNISHLDSMTLDVVFLNCYNYLEKFKNYYVKNKNLNIVLGLDEIEMNKYYFSKGRAINEGKFIKDKREDKPSWFNSLAGIFIDYFEIANLNSVDIKNLNSVKNWRNDYIHNDKSYFKKVELMLIFNLCLKATNGIRE
ncbi:response regulator [Maribacter ulvicola]|uniref:Response regulator receiver domain-containing protein n=1 Tax=Maribacter ulvicola TaxID=228959 RepID=A0A1N6WRM3_9FLAO|nr:response regulator [Maribacter ulvicola]SIQ92682.1 Response regulator receiver domain-containing protein [Maribacter ulvicola]